ncbi:NADP-dependent oxidoreductase domain-containing protein [Lipomyces kononenkoae]|uniref:NADP-dependent oxidoreductase domain-containing protein n=1 Tax=Lipomyces kononenkoae TaxID=34357 RepID=A0ACC3T354_LIPKO
MSYVQLPTPPAEPLVILGTVGSRERTAGLDGLPPLVLGGAQFNYQYNDDPYKLPAKDIIRHCFEAGVCAIDTSAYYGPSEILIGKALADPEIAASYSRDTYYLITKAGRIAETEFDFSPTWMRHSVERSLKRLHTDYLDIVYAHDVEFVALEDTLPGIAELFKMKEEGIIRNVGISGYPVPVLVTLCRLVRARLGKTIDVVLSYSNFTIQNRRLKNSLEDFYAAGVKKVLNGSPLSMSLLRSQPPHAFHPASPDLKRRVALAANHTASKNVELADLSMRYALRNWQGTTVVGYSSLFEVNAGIKAYWESQNKDITAADEELLHDVHEILGPGLDEVWSSGLKQNYEYTI